MPSFPAFRSCGQKYGELEILMYKITALKICRTGRHRAIALRVSHAAAKEPNTTGHIIDQYGLAYILSYWSRTWISDC